MTGDCDPRLANCYEHISLKGAGVRRRGTVRGPVAAGRPGVLPWGRGSTERYGVADGGGFGMAARRVSVQVGAVGGNLGNMSVR